MRPSLIKNNRAFVLAEVLVAAVLALSMIGAVVSFYYFTHRTYSSGSLRQWLQADANNLLAKILEGKNEPGGTFRLSEAVSYNIVSISELRFTGTDGVERWYRLSNPATSVIYHHPTAAGTIDEVIYTAPAGALVTLRFSIPAGAQYTGVVVGIDAAITKNVEGSALSGSASTYVNIRNHAA